MNSQFLQDAVEVQRGYKMPRSLYLQMLVSKYPWLAEQLGEETLAVPTSTLPTATAPTPETMPTPLPAPVPDRSFYSGRIRKWNVPRRYFQQPLQQQQSAPPQFYDHQMALVAEQNARLNRQQPQQETQSSGIGGISWPVIALAGGGFLMLMMVMMSGKK